MLIPKMPSPQARIPFFHFVCAHQNHMPTIIFCYSGIDLVRIFIAQLHNWCSKVFHPPTYNANISNAYSPQFPTMKYASHISVEIVLHSEIPSERKLYVHPTSDASERTGGRPPESTKPNTDTPRNWRHSERKISAGVLCIYCGTCRLPNSGDLFGALFGAATATAAFCFRQRLAHYF